MHSWSDQEIEAAKQVLGQSSELPRALEYLTNHLGFEVTGDALQKAFRRRHLAAPTTWLRKPVARELPSIFEEDEEKTEPQLVVPVHHVEGLTDRILTAVKYRPLDYVALSDKLNVPSGDVKAAVQRAITDGAELSINDGHVSVFHRRGSEAQSVGGFNDYVGHHIVAAVSDTHIGNMWAAEDELYRFCHYAYGLGCRTILHVGDILDGNKKELIPEQDLVGFDRQSLRATQVFPALKGLRYYTHTGNHDEYYAESSGMSPGRALENRFREVGRDDWHHVGRCGSIIRVESASWELNHPHGGTGTNSGVMGVLEGIVNERDELPDFELTGHFHKYVAGIRKGCNVIACATWQRKGSPFSNRIKGPWAVGGVIVEYDVDDDGRIDCVSTRFVSADRFAVAA